MERRGSRLSRRQLTAGGGGAGVRHLLREAAWHAEQSLHVARGVLLLALVIIALLVWGLWRQASPRELAGIAGLALSWLAIAWLLYRGPSRPWLPYVLIALDTLLLTGLAVVVPLQALSPAQDAERLLAEELNATLSPLFVLLALSGMLRLSVPLALYSTALAVGGVLTSALLMSLSPRAALPELIVVGVAGVLGLRASQALRSIEIRAEEEMILEHYVPEPLVADLMLATEPLHPAGHLIAVTLLIVDIRGFTTLSEPMRPVDAVALLNEYFAAVLVPLTREGGYLDKYLGDGLLAFFEPDATGGGTDHAARGLRAAQGMLTAMEAFNAARPEQPPIRIGVAVHSGEVLIGSVGAPERLNYTAIGDAVNVTARLEELNKQFPSVLVASAATVEQAGGAAPAGLVGPQEVPIRGRHGDLSVYYLPVETRG
jgi:class 3 adenylate cyclase